jgi:predicted NAD/FAD-binding protein
LKPLLTKNVKQQLPKHQAAAWNCSLVGDGGVVRHGQATKNAAKRISITFDMNRLQSIPSPGEKNSPGRVLVSMNPLGMPSAVQGQIQYSHPLISHESLLMTRHLHRINGVSCIYFAGAWMGYGFHEDGFTAGAHAARLITDGHASTPPLDLIQDIQDETAAAYGAGVARLALRFGVGMVQRVLCSGAGLQQAQQIHCPGGRAGLVDDASHTNKMHGKSY